MKLTRRQFGKGAAGLLAMAATGTSLPARADSGRVVLYNPGGAKLADALVAAFNKHHPDITVDVINAGVGELFTRIEAESASPNGDVLMGASVEAYKDKPDLFEPYVTADDAAYPREFVGENSLYYGLDLLLQTFMINTDRMSEEEAPKSWADLADPKYKGRIVLANPSLSGSAYGQFGQLLQLYGWDVAAKVVENATFLNSPQLVWQGVAKGEYDMCVINDNNVVSLAREGYPVKAIYPSEGVALRFSANAMIKGAPNQENAKKLLDFLNSKEAHEISVGITNRRSVRPDVAPPEGQLPFDQIKTFVYDDAKAAAEREENLRKFDELFALK